MKQTPRSAFQAFRDWWATVSGELRAEPWGSVWVFGRLGRGPR